jgi:hypothetical protein
LYWDQGENFDYLKGHFYRQSFTCESSAQGVTVSLSAVEGDYEPWWKSVKVVVYGDQAAKSATTNGAQVKMQFANGANSFEVPNARTTTKIEIAY